MKQMNAAPRAVVGQTTAAADEPGNPGPGPAVAAPYRERVVNRMLRYARKMLYSRMRRMRRA